LVDEVLKTWSVVVATLVVAVGGAFADHAGAVGGPDDHVVVVRGRGTLDGAPFDSRFLGAVVQRHGLVTPCQQRLPRVRAGRFAIPVYARADSIGCGGRGGEVFLWTFVNDQILYSNESVSWPGNGKTATLDPTFSTAAPNGGVGAIVGFAGEVYGPNGQRLPPGARVEAFIDETRCAVATTRRIEDFTGFSIDIVGPDAIPGCAIGATIRFRVNGRFAAQTALNQPGQSEALDLSLR
jgi:hypothetical protein